MPQKRLKMKQVTEILRLRYELNCSQQAIADATGIARSTVKDYLRRAKLAGLGWPLPSGMTHEQVTGELFPSMSKADSQRQRPEPDWKQVHQELKRKAVTLQLLWEEYKLQYPDGYQYSWFASGYRQWAKQHQVWMPQVHKAGEKAFVDYSGLTVPIWKTNLVEPDFKAEIFVSALGGSDLIFCTATRSQQLADWIDSHNQMFCYYGGVSELIVPDNLRSAVTRPHRYEPQCQTSYHELAQHYGCAIMPARSYKPKDKAKAEKAVQLVQQRILAPLRDQRFCALEQLNGAIKPLLEALNDRHSKAFGCSRRALFNAIEKSALKPLPGLPYELALWSQQQINGGYHITVNRHHYSVPYQFVGKKVDIRTTEKTVEIFYQEERIACHLRSHESGSYSTVTRHRPESHQKQIQANYQELMTWARRIGSATAALINQVFQDEKRHLHQKERSAQGILRLSHAYSEDALERVSAQAMQLGTHRYDSLVSLLKRLPAQKCGDDSHSFDAPDHENIRGADYYH